MVNYLYYITSRKDYYQGIAFPKHNDSFFKLEKERNNQFVSERKIELQDLSFGDSINDIIRKMGKPRYELSPDNFSEKILFYKDSISGNKVITQLHFFDNKFLIAVKTVHSLEVKFRKLIKTALLSKYSSNNLWIEEYSTGMKDFSFKDNNGTIVFIEEGVLLQIMYVNDYTTLKSYIENKERNRINSEKKKINLIITDIAANF